MKTWKFTGALIALTLFVIILLSPPPEGLSKAGWYTAATGLLMAILWITEFIPIPATSLLPLVLFPLLNIATIKSASAPYANPLIFLFMGGFIIALAMQKWNLHRRIALSLISFIGTEPGKIIAGFMVSTALISMWVSNTATALMMLPIGLSVIEISSHSDSNSNEKNPFAIVLLLGIAFSASIGGTGTLIGTPPNALLAGFMQETYNYTIGFAQWMGFGIPLVLVGLPITYLMLTFGIFRLGKVEIEGGKQFIQKELHEMGPITREEKYVAIIFAITAASWIFRPFMSKIIPGITDAGVAIMGALLTFLIPVNWKKAQFIMDWETAKKLPWGILLLFGGGLSLAWAISNSGLSTWIGQQLSNLSDIPLILLLLINVSIIVFLTGFTSNTATAAAFLPIMASVATSIGQNPLLFAIPSAVAASCAFMLPVATPPNAIVYSSGKVPIGEMARSGVILNCIFILIVTILAFILAPLIFNIEFNTVPQWAYLL